MAVVCRLPKSLGPQCSELQMWLISEDAVMGHEPGDWQSSSQIRNMVRTASVIRYSLGEASNGVLLTGSVEMIAGAPR